MKCEKKGRCLYMAMHIPTWHSQQNSNLHWLHTICMHPWFFSMGRWHLQEGGGGVAVVSTSNHSQPNRTASSPPPLLGAWLAVGQDPLQVLRLKGAYPLPLQLPPPPSNYPYLGQGLQLARIH